METEPSPAAEPGGKQRETDEEILAWARRRGYVSFAFFFFLAAVVATVWAVTR